MQHVDTFPSDTRSPIFIGGQRRSGTTLLRVMLNRHPHIACGPESTFPQDTEFIAWHERLADEWGAHAAAYGLGREVLDRSVAALIDNLFTRYQLKEGKRRWAEKTPTNIQRIDYLFRLFPHAQFIHVIRDPRDAYCSIRDRAATDKQHWARFTPERSARDWRKSIKAGRPWRAHPDRYREVRYEDLVSEPEATMRDLLGFLDEPWHSRVLDPQADNDEARAANIHRHSILPTSVGRWRTELDEADVAAIEGVARVRMLELGYEVQRKQWVI